MLEFSIYDSKAEAYLPPIYAPTLGLALRMFEYAANNADTNISKFAADYTLFETGTWNDQTALTTNCKAHISHGTALEFRTDLHKNPPWGMKDPTDLVDPLSSLGPVIEEIKKANGKLQKEEV